MYGISGAFRRAGAINAVLLGAYSLAVPWVQRVDTAMLADKKRALDTREAPITEPS